MRLDNITTQACHKAMKACVDQLKELGWSSEDILAASATLLPRLRAEAKSILDGAVADLTEALSDPCNYLSALRQASFNLEFVLAGNRVARAIDSEKKTI